MTLKQKMVNEMFKRIKKGPARADVKIFSKKHFAGEQSKWKTGTPNTLCIFHWYKGDYHVRLDDYRDDTFKLIGEGFKSWKEAFEWAADYILNNDF